GGVGGFSQQIFNEERVDSGLYTRAWLYSQMVATLGGRAAEAEVFGESEVTVGASNDLQTVTQLAREMVTRYGMSELGLVALDEPTDWWQRPNYSDELAHQVDELVRAMIQKAYQQARELLRAHRPLMDQLVERLLEQETIEGEEFYRIVRDYQAQHQPLPVG
ncbi:MAG: cell division protein FtsH, partial [Gloeomargarita sp. HHBFW_bins_205]